MYWAETTATRDEYHLSFWELVPVILEILRYQIRERYHADTHTQTPTPTENDMF